MDLILWRHAAAAAGVSDLLATGPQQVLVVGHQPTRGMTAAALLSGDAISWAVKKGAVWWLSNRTRGGESGVVLKVVIGPELL